MTCHCHNNECKDESCTCPCHERGEEGCFYCECKCEEKPKDTTRTAYAVVYKKDHRDYDSEAIKGTIDSIHITLRLARLHQDSSKHVVKKIFFDFK